MAHPLRPWGGGSVRDRLSFRRFCGLPLEVETPDHASIWRFRQTIEKLGLSAALLSETNRQLDALGLIVRRGTLIDATLIAAAVKRPPWGDGGVNPRDPDARVTMKRKKAHFGYKGHLAVDQGSGLVRQAEMTSANVHNSRLGEALVQGDEQAIFADRAYDSQAFRESLRRRAHGSGLAHRPARRAGKGCDRSDKASVDLPGPASKPHQPERGPTATDLKAHPTSKKPKPRILRSSQYHRILIYGIKCRLISRRSG